MFTVQVKAGAAWHILRVDEPGPANPKGKEGPLLPRFPRPRKDLSSGTATAPMTLLAKGHASRGSCHELQVRPGEQSSLSVTQDRKAGESLCKEHTFITC